MYLHGPHLCERTFTSDARAQAACKCSGEGQRAAQMAAAELPSSDGAEAAAPVQIFVGGAAAGSSSKGYVWDVEEALQLRRSYRVQGSFVGGVSQYKNQNAIMGLPMELSADEVTFLLFTGRAVLRAAVLDAGPLMQQQQQRQQQQQQQQQRQQQAGAGSSQSHSYKRRPHWQKGEEEYYFYYKGVGAYEEGWDAAAINEAAHRPMLPIIQQQQQQQGEEGAVPAPVPGPSSRGSGQLYADDAHKEAAWKLPLQDGSLFIVPLTAAEARQQPGAGARLPPSPPSLTWTYPSTPLEWLRFTIYSDLHSKGYTLSCGVKFGADLLAYPGAPEDFHAQFTVRPVLPSCPVNPILLKSAARGSHTARKHLMLASSPDLAAWMQSCGDPGADCKGQGLVARLDWLRGLTLPPVTYLSIAPEAGFGRA